MAEKQEGTEGFDYYSFYDRSTYPANNVYLFTISENGAVQFL